MLEDVLSRIGLHTSGHALDLEALLDPFSHWVETQDVQPDDVAFLAGLIGGFICEFLIEHGAATRVIRGDRIFLHMPVQNGLVREIEPYAVALEFARRRGSVSEFLHVLIA